MSKRKSKMKFNYNQGSATKPGPIHKTILISKDHSLHPYIFKTIQDEILTVHGKVYETRTVKREYSEAIELLKSASPYIQGLALDCGIVRESDLREKAEVEIEQRN